VVYPADRPGIEWLGLGWRCIPFWGYKQRSIPGGASHLNSHTKVDKSPSGHGHPHGRTHCNDLIPEARGFCGSSCRSFHWIEFSQLLELSEKERKQDWGVEAYAPTGLIAESNTLRQGQVLGPVQCVGLPAHVGLPSIGAGFPSSSGFLFSPEGATDLRA
jgi:hypothetical protein